MINNKILSFLLISIFLFTLISAEGLTINPNEFEVDKIYEENEVISFNISNPTTYNFTNISFEDNDYIEMEEISKLKSGDSKTINANIFGNEDFEGEIEIKGYFYAEDIGEEDKTHDIVIEQDDSVNPGDLSIYQGDKLKFTNNKDEYVFVKITKGGDEINEKIEVGGNYIFSDTNGEDNLRYYFYSEEDMPSWSLTDTYDIDVLPTSGLITHPNFNPKLNLKLTLNYPPTNISTNLPDTTYEIEPFSETDGILSITNDGSELARKINLDSRWFSFSENNFDIESGQTKGIIYTISPKVTNTNQTNKTYIEKLKISGNFDTINEEFNITIPYADIEDGQYTEGKSLLDWIKEYCEMNPDDEICGGKKEVIYKDREENISIETGNEQFKEFVNYMISKIKDIQKDNSQLKEIVTKLNESSSSEKQTNDEIKSELQKSNQIQDEKNEFIYSVLIIAFTFLSSLLLGLIIWFIKKQNKLPDYLNSIWKKINKNQ